ARSITTTNRSDTASHHQQRQIQATAELNLARRSCDVVIKEQQGIAARSASPSTLATK
ncbi:Hypothetical predicted protein, partial [Olea europaea subsp. europaea]